MAAVPPIKKRPTAAPILGDGFPVAFADGPAKDSYAAICIFCVGQLARVRLIEKGQGRGGYAVLCPECTSTIFLCRPESVKRWRAMQALLRDTNARQSYFNTLEVLTPQD